MIRDLVRKHVRELTPYTCARDLYQQGLLLDANENAFGSAAENPFRIPLNRYPDPECKSLKKALAFDLQYSEEYFFVGSGSDEIIGLLVKLFVEEGEEAIVLEPTYGMYRVAALANAAKVKTCPLGEEFQIDFNALAKAVGAQSKLLFCCSPNSPTGNLLDEESIIRLCSEFKGVVVLDEAYVEFSSKASHIRKTKQFENLVILRTFSKAWGLAGLRVGYAITNPTIIQYLNKVKLPYNVSALSARLAEDALKNKKQMFAWKKEIIREKTKVSRALVKYGFEVFPSEANFVMVRRPNAAALVKTLAVSHGIIVRDVSEKLGLKDCFRITIGKPEENKKLLKALYESA